MLFLDGVYVTSTDALTFRRVNAPSRAELDALIERIGHRVGRYLERAGLLVRDAENSYLSLESAETTAMDDLRGAFGQLLAERLSSLHCTISLFQATPECPLRRHNGHTA